MTFTTVQYIRMVQVANLPSGSTTQYTTPGSRQDVIKCVTLCNVTGTTAVVSVTVAGSHLFFGASVPAAQTLSWTGTLVMNAGDTIVTASGTASAFDMTVSGLESQ